MPTYFSPVSKWKAVSACIFSLSIPQGSSKHPDTHSVVSLLLPLGHRFGMKNFQPERKCASWATLLSVGNGRTLWLIHHLSDLVSAQAGGQFSQTASWLKAPLSHRPHIFSPSIPKPIIPFEGLTWCPQYLQAWPAQGFRSKVGTELCISDSLPGDPSPLPEGEDLCTK